jgi:hypothetical protein
MSTWLAMALSAALLAQQAAPAATAAKSEDETTLEGLVVTAKPLPQKEAIESFVAGISAETGNKRLGRWDRKVCPGVVGLRNDYSQLMIDRIAGAAVEIGLEVGEPGCKANIIVLGTAEADKLARSMIKQYPDAFAKYDGGIRPPRRKLNAFMTSDAPVRWWHVTRRTTADGQRYDLGETMRVRDGGRLKDGTRDDFDRVIIILDVTRIGKLKFATLADYVAMVALAQVDADADTGGALSVLNLFSDREAGAEPVDQLTEWDKAYLTGLYDARRDVRRGAAQEDDIARSMGEDLSGKTPPVKKTKD